MNRVNLFPFRFDIAEEDASKRARKSVVRSSDGVRGCLTSSKTFKMVEWESQLERKAVMMFEFNRSIVAFRDQPLRVYLSSWNGFVPYTPDFEVQLASGEIVFIEVKPSEKLQDKDVLWKMREASVSFRQRGYVFGVLTETELEQPARLSNQTLLRPYLRQPLDSKRGREISEWIKKKRCARYCELVTFLGSRAVALQAIAQGFLKIDEHEIFSLDSVVKPNLENRHETMQLPIRTAPNFVQRSLSNPEDST